MLYDYLYDTPQAELYLLIRENNSPQLFSSYDQALRQLNRYASDKELGLSIRSMAQIEVNNPKVQDFLRSQGFVLVDGFYYVDRLTETVFCLALNRIDGKIDLVQTAGSAFYYMSIYRFDNGSLKLIDGMICHEAVNTGKGVFICHEGLRIPLRQFKKHFARISKR
jgi:hypothetical protein